MIALIVDDCAISSGFIAETLQREADCDCQIAATYDDAVYKFNQIVFDAYLCDIDLKDSQHDGIDFVAYALTKAPRAEIVVYTGIGPDKARERLKTLYPRTVGLCLEKPIVKDVLVAHLKQIADRKGGLNVDHYADHERITAEIEKHAESCGKTNALTYVKKPNPLAQMMSIVSLLVVVSGTIGAYYLAEGAQNTQQATLAQDCQTTIERLHKVEIEQDKIKAEYMRVQEETNKKLDQMIQLLKTGGK